MAQYDAGAGANHTINRNGLRQLKAALSKAAARSIEVLLDAIAVALAAFTAEECMNFFAAPGYDRV
ncbi:hypothetical protein [Nitrobacter sp. JJSN]|uniref:hypothetical protein n=1 Tax=Nitrobacter sp. JJSN TaxID=3453033 RepID=UPI003F772279